MDKTVKRLLTGLIHACIGHFNPGYGDHTGLLADNPPSGTKYIHDGIMPKSLGVLEHWDNDLSRKYYRNLNPKKGKGIELIYMPL